MNQIGPCACTRHNGKLVDGIFRERLRVVETPLIILRTQGKWEGWIISALSETMSL